MILTFFKKEPPPQIGCNDKGQNELVQVTEGGGGQVNHGIIQQSVSPHESVAEVLIKPCEKFGSHFDRLSDRWQFV